ncbi:DMT family transporter [Amycolatopsis anabasis]|uniref:DMT family transporter n=1 Tax=Amycolatopsis anabasis TaxID=1840409 RepID=UPI00131E2A39|nr:DMT family transporter [Amycolatopsis anabasis]
MTTTEAPAQPATAPANPLSALADRIDARVLAAVGSLCISASSMFVKLSGTSAGTSVFYRCLLALPILIPLAWWERRRAASGIRRRVALPLIAGALLGVDLVLWCEAIGTVGAGIATVLVAVQVVIVPGLAFLFFRERPHARYLLAVPVMLGGIVLAGGIADTNAFGPDPVYGTVTGVLAGAAYAGYLLLLRVGTGPGTQVHSVCLATVSAGAVALALGLPWHGIDFAPGWPAFGWLIALAVAGQAVGWLLIAAALPRLSASTGATLLLLQPIGAVLLGVGLLGEAPSWLQLTGCAAVIAAVCFATGRARDR